jgi:hypothetical protein
VNTYYALKSIMHAVDEHFTMRKAGAPGWPPLKPEEIPGIAQQYAGGRLTRSEVEKILSLPLIDVVSNAIGSNESEELCQKKSSDTSSASSE